ncbi:MAG: transposase [Rhodomicrobiaceae bacterium]
MAYLWIDAIYLKVRRGGRIVSVAAIVAVAVNTDGRWEVFGIDVTPSDAESFWSEFLRSLADPRPARRQADHRRRAQRLEGVVLSAAIQRCRVHVMRNALACVGKKDKPIVTAALRSAFEADSQAGILTVIPLWVTWLVVDFIFRQLLRIWRLCRSNGSSRPTGRWMKP